MVDGPLGGPEKCGQFSNPAGPLVSPVEWRQTVLFSLEFGPFFWRELVLNRVHRFTVRPPDAVEQYVATAHAHEQPAYSGNGGEHDCEESQRDVEHCLNTLTSVRNPHANFPPTACSGLGKCGLVTSPPRLLKCTGNIGEQLV
jgi:hypothetical protein